MTQHGWLVKVRLGYASPKITLLISCGESTILVTQE